MFGGAEQRHPPRTLRGRFLERVPNDLDIPGKARPGTRIVREPLVDGADLILQTLGPERLEPRAHRGIGIAAHDHPLAPGMVEQHLNGILRQIDHGFTIR